MPPAVVAVAGAVKGAVAAAGIMKSMAVAGTALSAVGAVTKNPKLTKIGAVVGGIGTLGTMGAFGAGAKTLGMAKTATSFAAPAAPSLTRQALTQGPLRSGYQQQAQSGGLLRSAIADRATSNLLPSAAPPSLFQKAGNVLSAGAKLIKDNPEVAQVLAAGGAELANYLSGKTDADIDLLKSQIKNTDANAQKTLDAIENEKRRRQNLNQGYLSVNTSLRPTGLLSQNMQGVSA